MPVSGSNKKRPTLSICMIVRNAADLLPITLDSVRQIADEIVILDTGSEDGTLSIAEKAGANVFRSEWKTDFSVARNECARHATCDWILCLDAGETLDEKAAQQLRNFVDNEATLEKAYMLFVQLPPTSKQLEGEQIGQVRLMPRDKNIVFQGCVRESVVPSVIENGLELDALFCTINRPACDAEFGIKAAKAVRNLRILGCKKKTNDEITSVTDCLVEADAIHILGDRDKAKNCFRKALECAERGSSQMLEAYYGLLTTYDGHPGEHEEQITTCLEALDVYPLDAQLLCGMGSYLLNQKRVDLAARSYELAATHGQVDPTTWHMKDIAEIATTCLCLTYQLQGDMNEAIAILKQTLEQRPESLRLRKHYIEILIKKGDREEAMRQFELLPEIPHREALRSAIRGAMLASQKDFVAAEPYLKTAFSAGCRETLCMRWLVACYFALGRRNNAKPILEAWRTCDPLDAEAIAYENAISNKQTRPNVPSLDTMATGISAPKTKQELAAQKTAPPRAISPVSAPKCTDAIPMQQTPTGG